ncbi:MAG: hypothetical protein ABR568_05075 [Pyrinomonadaceae bacterium]
MITTAAILTTVGISPTLTVNLGLRYELQTRQRERGDRQSFFDYSPGSPTYGMLVPANNGGHREQTFSNLDNNNFAPRIGFAWQLNQNTVVRGGFGIFYSGVGYYAITQSGAANPPHFVRIAFNSPTTAANTALRLSDGFPADGLNPARAVNPELYGQPQDFPQTEIYQGNIDVQREVWGGIVMSVAYVGSGTAKLRGLNDINAPKPGPGATAAPIVSKLWRDQHLIGLRTRQLQRVASEARTTLQQRLFTAAVLHLEPRD